MSRSIQMHCIELMERDKIIYVQFTVLINEFSHDVDSNKVTMLQ